MLRRHQVFIGSALLCVLLAGCGGGGAPMVDNVPDDPLPTSEVTAKFAVDVTGGEVSVSHLSTDAPSIFDGSTIRFTTSTLLDQPGNTGRKVLGVTLTNESGEPIGLTPSGLETGVMVRFGPFVNVASFSDLRPQTQVSTLAGTGANGTADGSGGSVTFSAPFGVALSEDGAIIVTDSTGHKVRMIRNGVVTTMAGTGVAGNTDGAGTSAKLNGPAGIARNPVDGAYFICDNLGNRIRRMTSNGVVATIAGTGAAGSANGAGSAATFTGPRGIAITSDGTIYVTEDGHRIRRILFNGGAPDSAANYTVSNRAGDGTAGFQNGSGASARFNLPAGIAVDENGAAYVADRGNNRIRRIGTGGDVATIAGDGAGGGADGVASAARFSQPVGIAYANGALAVSERNGRRVRQITLTEGAAPNAAENWRVATLAGDGTAGSTDGSGSDARFDTPGLIALSSGNEVFVADTANNKVRRVTPKNGVFPVGTPGGPVPTDKVALANATGFTGRDRFPYITYPGSLSPGENTGQQEWVFVVPQGVNAFEFSVTVEADTAYYVGLDGVSNPGPSGAGSPNNFVRAIAGGDLGGFLDGPASVAKFNSANGIAIDESGNIYLADTNNNAIRRVEPSGYVSTIAGLPGNVGTADGPGNVAGLNGPRGVAVNPSGTKVFVTDSNNHTVRVVSFTGSNPRDPASWYVSTIAGLAGDAVFLDGRGNAARFNFPYGIAYQTDDILYVTEFSGNRVRRLELLSSPATLANNWQVSLVAGSSVSPVGTAGTTNGFGTSARFDLPAHICVDVQGNLYVADVNNSRIRKILPNTNVSTFAGSTFGYADGVGEAAMFGQPNGVTVDPAGYVYVADTSTHRVRRISPTGVVTTAAGNGNTFPEVDGPGSVNNFYFPLGIAVNRTGTVYVVSGGTYEFEGGGGVTSPGLRIKSIQRILSKGAP